ncbi:unnamed protein product [Adineta steineri]|uniref:Uncharacterized protein n=1 Tax=Adineta steineri TaxID=433720 RepID=A0A818HHY4_9BILA|nr:unnamed protein product [Adineta steineri]CAF1335661.1 unnamed protein product [Adineta steineri]CAF3508334.1 unnamed protein product [Adineta steineri]CAF3693480.1 unnamed protein product [Adineta steineri]
MSEGAHQLGDKQSNDKKPEDPSHPGMDPDPAERGKQLGHENAQGGQSVGTGGHGGVGHSGGNQPVGGKHASDASNCSEEQLHPGMNPDPAERGRQLGHENAHGGHSVGTGGHAPSGANMGK